jgi:hypothetical protein
LAKLSHQINPRLSPELLAAVKRRAELDGISKSAVIRDVLDWILPRIGESESIAALRRGGLPGRTYSRRVSAQLQDELHAALDHIFEHAPSAVVDEVGKELKKVAGRYGGEK